MGTGRRPSHRRNARRQRHARRTVPKAASHLHCGFPVRPPWRPPHDAGCRTLSSRWPSVFLLVRVSRMDLLNRAYSQLYERFRSMTPGWRLTVGLLAAVVLASLGYLLTHQVAADVELMPGVARYGQPTAGHADGPGQGELEGIRGSRDDDLRAARPGGRLHGRLGQSRGPAPTLGTRRARQPPAARCGISAPSANANG